MGLHRSSINFQNLIQDLSEMYLCEVSEVVLIELVANSLDAGADHITIKFDKSKKILEIKDNGRGMDAGVFEEYHDFAAGLKSRGDGIGFAGLGAKISFNIANRVITETKSRSFCGGSSWYLKSKKELVWENLKPSHLFGHGTKVAVYFRPDAKLTYSSSEDLIRLLRRYYLPLFDSRFLKLYKDTGRYSQNLRFEINGHIVKIGNIDKAYNLEKVKEFFPTKSGKKFGYGIMGISKSEYPLGADSCGILLCTLGKVIKSDLFNQFPSSLGPRLFGVVEVPDFVKYLTTAKTDFIHNRGTRREFESLYNPIRQEFKAWLKYIGVETAEVVGTNEAIKLEKELKKLIDDIPELNDFFGFRTRKSIFASKKEGPATTEIFNGTEGTFPFGSGTKGGIVGPVDIGEQPGQALIENKEKGKVKASPISRTARRGPKIAFSEAFNKLELAWIDGNNIVINSGHPAYVKSNSNVASRKIHNLFAIASAIQKFINSHGEKSDQMFIDRMMSAWGKK